MTKYSQNEVKESLLEMARIYQPNNVKKFVKGFIKRYRITGGYEEELTRLVQQELNKTVKSNIG